MTLARALAYFLREAAVSLVRSWKVSLLAILTIAVSLLIGGTFLLLSTNLAQAVERWRGEARLVLYLTPETSAEARTALAEELRGGEWVTAVEVLGPEGAAERFRATFPSLSELVTDDGAESLPASVSIAFAPSAAGSPAFEEWAAALAERPEVDLVDDDRDWLRQLSALVATVRAVGLTLGAVLLAAAVFTIAAVIRLTAYLYQEEISVMRLVGATEFYIRGPFYAEGALQGLIGGTMALLGLWTAYEVFVGRTEETLLGALLAPDFLDWRAVTAIVVLGTGAGLAGAVLSLRRERLGDSD